MRQKILFNGFRFIPDAIGPYLKGWNISFFEPQNVRFGMIGRFLAFWKLCRSGEIYQYDVVHVNAWENFLLIPHRRPGQVWILESHGLHVGLDSKKFFQVTPLPVRLLAYILHLFAGKRFKHAITDADIYYYSTPNLIDSAKKIRSDAKWLPNPMDTDLFTPRGRRVKLDGSPAVFMPTRLHAVKNAMFSTDIFRRIKERFPDAKLHLIDDHHANPLRPHFLAAVGESNYIMHDFLPPEEFAAFLRSADLVLGQFGVGANGLNELQAMACKAPLVTLDRYETVKQELDGLPDYAVRLLKDRDFRKTEVERNYRYVRATHSPRAIAQRYRKDIEVALRIRRRGNKL